MGGVEYETQRIPGAHPLGMSGAQQVSDGDALAETALRDRLGEIEGRPLDSRAAALAELHDELRARLEGGDAAAARG